MQPGSVLIEPDAARWSEGARERWGGWGRVRTGKAWELARATREALGLDADRPVIMSGHQPGFWHAGIAAKWFALGAAGDASGAQPAWVVVDHDATALGRVRVPVLKESGLGARWWNVHTGELAPSAGARERNAACDRAAAPAKTPAQMTSLASDAVRAGVERMARALTARAGEPNAARQFALAAADALEHVGPRPVLVFATDLVKTPAWGALFEAMRRDPAKCRDAYNGAARAFPAARVAPLEDGELPLWRLGGPERVRVLASDLEAGGGALAPRALLMTAILRMFVCDLFIHGTGGGASGTAGDADGAGYDRITERWIPGWLGDDVGGGAVGGGAAPLSPSVVASATLTLDLPGPAIDPLLAKARWTAHAARHDPAMLGDRGAALRKAEIVNALRSRRTTKGERRAAYLELHALLEDVRKRHAARLAELAAAAEKAGDAAEQLALRHDRTWAFPLHEAQKLGGLRDAVAGAFE